MIKNFITVAQQHLGKAKKFMYKKFIAKLYTACRMTWQVHKKKFKVVDYIDTVTISLWT